MKYVRRAWESYKKNWMSFILAELLVFIITGIIMGIGIGFILTSLGISSLMELSSPELMSKIVSILPLLTGVGTALIFFIIAGLVWLFLKIGIYGMAAKSLRGKTNVETMFKVAKKKGFTGILVSIVVGIVAFVLMSILVVGLGITFPVVGSIIGVIIFFLIMILFSLIFPGIVIDNLGTLGSIEKSFKVVKRNYLEMLGLLLFYGIVSIVVALIPILGILLFCFVISPMIKISLVFFYKRKK